MKTPSWFVYNDVEEEREVWLIFACSNSFNSEKKKKTMFWIRSRGLTCVSFAALPTSTRGIVSSTMTVWPSLISAQLAGRVISKTVTINTQYPLTSSLFTQNYYYCCCFFSSTATSEHRGARSVRVRSTVNTTTNSKNKNTAELQAVAPIPTTPNKKRNRNASNSHQDPFIADNTLLDSIVKVYAVISSPNYILPWQNKTLREQTGSGFAIVGKRILTNAHVVADQKYVMVRKRGSPNKYHATVEHVGHDCDLAVLRVVNESFWEGIRPLEFSSVPVWLSLCIVCFVYMCVLCVFCVYFVCILCVVYCCVSLLCCVGCVYRAVLHCIV